MPPLIILPSFRPRWTFSKDFRQGAIYPLPLIILTSFRPSGHFPRISGRGPYALHPRTNNFRPSGHFPGILGRGPSYSVFLAKISYFKTNQNS